VLVRRRHLPLSSTSNTCASSLNTIPISLRFCSSITLFFLVDAKIAGTMPGRRSGRLASQPKADYACRKFLASIQEATEYSTAITPLPQLPKKKTTRLSNDSSDDALPPTVSLTKIESGRVSEESTDEKHSVAHITTPPILQASGEGVLPLRSPAALPFAREKLVRTVEDSDDEALLATDNKRKKQKLQYSTDNLEDIYSSKTATPTGGLPIRAVLCVVRKSSRIVGSQKYRESKIDLYHKRNEELYQVFQEHVHPTLHAECKHACQAECFSFVLNGIGSNENIANHNHPDLREFRETLTTIQHDEGCVYIVYSGKDAMTTNLEGISKFFGNLHNVASIWLLLYLGENTIKTYKMTAILQAISHCREFGLPDKFVSDEYALLADWYSIMYNKEQ
jgi:hypothetical protein